MTKKKGHMKAFEIAAMLNTSRSFVGKLATAAGLKRDPGAYDTRSKMYSPRGVRELRYEMRRYLRRGRL